MSSVPRKIQYPLLISLAFTMSVDIPLFFTNAKLNNILIIIVALNTVLMYVADRQRPATALRWMMVLFILPYAVYLLGLLKTDNFPDAVSDLTEQKIALLIFPVVCYLMPRLTEKQVRNILLAFVAGCISTMIICLSVATYRYLNTGTTLYFTYHELSMILQMHAVYLAMYCCFAIAILVYFFSREKSARILYSVSIVFLVISIFLLSGRTHIAILVAGGTIGLIKLFNQRDRLVVAVAKAGLLGIIITGIALLFPTNRLRFKQAINYNNEFGMDRQWGEQQMRPLMWDCATHLISQKPMTGWGTGDGQDALHQCYIENEYTSLTYLVNDGIRFNAHNQYLEIIIGLGVIGLIVFLAMLSVSFAYAIREKNTLWIIFLMLFSLSCLTESLLERRSGCIFYAFFNSFLFFHALPSRNRQTKAA